MPKHFKNNFEKVQISQKNRPPPTPNKGHGSQGGKNPKQITQGKETPSNLPKNGKS